MSRMRWTEQIIQQNIQTTTIAALEATTKEPIRTNITSTIGIDMKSSNILKDRVTVAVWDFAGQPQYITTHQVQIVLEISKVMCEIVISWCSKYNLFLSSECRTSNRRY